MSRNFATTVWTHDGVPGSASGLDGAFPITSYATGIESHYNDSPGVQGSPSLPANFTYQRDGFFYTYEFYMPPNDVAGASVWIPIELIPWEAHGDCSSDSTGLMWTQHDDGSILDQLVPYPPFPNW